VLEVVEVIRVTGIGVEGADGEIHGQLGGGGTYRLLDRILKPWWGCGCGGESSEIFPGEVGGRAG
jgi:hypothetical protein